MLSGYGRTTKHNKRHNDAVHLFKLWIYGVIDNETMDKNDMDANKQNPYQIVRYRKTERVSILLN